MAWCHQAIAWIDGRLIMSGFVDIQLHNNFSRYWSFNVFGNYMYLKLLPYLPGASGLLSGVPDFFDRNKILSGYDLSHYQVPHCIKSFLLFCLICVYSSQFYFELCTYYNILDIYLSQNLNFVNYLLFYMKLLNYLFFNMFGSVLECCELTGVSLL